MYVCPICKTSNFNVKIIKTGTVELIDDGNGNTNPSITKENDDTDIVFVSCMNCIQSGIETIIEQDGSNLIKVESCKNCGDRFAEDELDENGICESCNTPREDLIGLSEKDYVRKIIFLEKEITTLKASSQLQVTPEVFDESLITDDGI